MRNQVSLKMSVKVEVNVVRCELFSSCSVFEGRMCTQLRGFMVELVKAV